jgi:hypothetical protein
LRLILLAVLVAFAVSAVSSASASANLAWYECKNVSPNGVFQDAACLEFGPPDTYAWVRVNWGLLLFFTSYMKWFSTATVAGVKVKIECKEGKGEGWFENPISEGFGIDYSDNKLTECSVPEPSGQGCKIAGTPEFKANSELTEFKGKPADEFTPHEGSVLVSFTFEGCSTKSLDTTYQVTGKIIGVASGMSSLEFTEESSEIKFAGEKAKLTGSDRLEAEGGDAVKIE